MAADRYVHVTYFLEDIAHEQFVPPLVERLAHELAISLERVDVRGKTSSVSRGSGVLVEFKRFLHDARQAMIADLTVVCIDGNSDGYQKSAGFCKAKSTKRILSGRLFLLYQIPISNAGILPIWSLYGRRSARSHKMSLQLNKRVIELFVNGCLKKHVIKQV